MFRVTEFLAFHSFSLLYYGKNTETRYIGFDTDTLLFSAPRLYHFSPSFFFTTGIRRIVADKRSL